jgi:WD40 repeat protein
MQTGKELYRVKDTEQTWSSRFSPDGKTALVATGGWSTRPSDIIVWDVQTGKEIRRLTGHPAGILFADFSPDGRMAISIGGQGTVILWDMPSGQQIKRFPAHDNNNALDTGAAASFSPDGRTVLAGLANGTIILWDVATAQEIRRFVGHTNIVGSLLFSPDGRTVVSSSWDNTVILWDVATGKIIQRMADHSASVYRMALSPDGRFAFAGSSDNTSTLWDLKTGQLIRRFNLAKTNSAAGFSPDGHSILVGLQDGSVQLWRIDSPDEMSSWVFGNRYVPDLDCRQRDLYRLKPTCDSSGSFPTHTPFPTTASPATTAPQ